MKGLLLVLVCLGLAAAQPSICEKYFTDDCQAQYDGMSTLINKVVEGLLGNDATVDYFNGVNPGSTDFTSPSNSAALATLIDHLITFFGKALGCCDQAANYTGNPNMKLVHSFETPVNKAAFENFNQIVIRTARNLGVDMGDIVTIAFVLDGFRTGNGDANAQLCLDADCVTSPYTVLVGDPAVNATGSPNFFNPPWISVPTGFTINYQVVMGSHTATEAENTTADQRCVELEDGWSSPTPITGGAYARVVDEAEGTLVPYYCKFHCSSAQDTMWGQYKVLAAVETTTTTGTTTGTTGTTTGTTGTTTTRATTGTTGSNPTTGNDDDAAASLIPVGVAILAALALLF